MKDWNNLTCTKCGLINDYTITEKNNQRVCTCNGCGHFLGNKPREDIKLNEFKMPFGKYQGRLIFEIQDKPYLTWILDNTKVSGNIRKSIEARVKMIW